MEPEKNPDVQKPVEGVRILFDDLVNHSDCFSKNKREFATKSYCYVEDTGLLLLLDYEKNTYSPGKDLNVNLIDLQEGEMVFVDHLGEKPFFGFLGLSNSIEIDLRFLSQF